MGSFDRPTYIGTRSINKIYSWKHRFYLNMEFIISIHSYTMATKECNIANCFTDFPYYFWLLPTPYTHTHSHLIDRCYIFSGYIDSCLGGETYFSLRQNNIYSNRYYYTYIYIHTHQTHTHTHKLPHANT